MKNKMYTTEVKDGMIYYTTIEPSTNDCYLFSYYKSLLPSTQESQNCVKSFGFIEVGRNRWRNGFTEIRKLGNARYTIRHEMNKNYHVTNIEDMPIYCKNFLRLNGY